MRFAVAPFLVGVAFPVSATASEAEAIAKAASPWRASLEDQTCSLQRSFELGKQKIVLDIRLGAPNYGYELNVVADGLKRTSDQPETQFGGRDGRIKHEFSYKLSSDGWEGFAVSVPSDHFKAARDNASAIPLAVRRAFKTDFVLPLQLKQPLAIMDDCLNALVESWGLDPLVQRQLSRRIDKPRGKWDWFTHAMIDTEKERDRLGQDQFRMRLIVDPVGKVSSCHLYGGLADSEAGAKACEKIKKRAKFDPALDRDGNPVSSFFYMEGTTFTGTSTLFL